jgi:hypothetical protein
MGSLARNMALLTLPALAVGALAGFGLRLLSPAEEEPAEDGGESPAEIAPRPEKDRTRGSRRRERASAAERGAGRTRRVVGNTAEGVEPLDPSFAERLSSTDEDVRFACALELLRLGPSRADAVDLLAPSTPEGVRIRDAIVNSLGALGTMERGGAWSMMSEQSRQEVRLKYFAKVVPLSHLRDERLRYWSVRVAGDAERLASGSIGAGEAAWAVLELASVRLEKGELGADQWTKLRAEKLGAVRSWVAELAAQPGAPREKVAAVREAIARLEKL